VLPKIRRKKGKYLALGSSFCCILSEKRGGHERQHAPLTTGSDVVEDGVQHFADVDRSFLARPVLIERHVVQYVQIPGRLDRLRSVWRRFGGSARCSGVLSRDDSSDRSFGSYRTGVRGMTAQHIQSHPQAKNSFYSKSSSTTSTEVYSATVRCGDLVSKHEYNTWTY
jgi:hypothetical protein